ncbi:lipocalin / cytosolic fatty-acid binding domain-containing protein [Pochonia chlamydosporia 170]|uniref:Lipocalin / cytosolic fatty-acid binding domain-containing protein n=1 Tax=Pochonia chlamydosporia 170 TaxID=1380566 RepID=A0A219AR85_METCM|nr:lipocalin / cytosolic fatty-acid binding domain-containing protein [Pochonia chlamydosporia 170]OWT43298.1 lipocalin / cytosolic fatty-acid binding domain-containing protein [Pochonia chlamydosporia 170]
MTDVFSGKYKLSKSTNFDEFLTELGKSTRQLVKSASPELQITRNGDGWHVETKAGVGHSEFTFTLGEEFEEVRQDDVKVRSLVVQDGNKWTQTQTPVDGVKIVTIVREFGGSEMITTATVGDVTSTRIFDRVD